ncbi:MAG: hypothetical protein KatS3mg015_2584 [Fimbriimonadales bacterium]|nr:MAG: hypothetical protein KatS3mg015_2584 [Fimbriimonadales bacterium]
MWRPRGNTQGCGSGAALSLSVHSPSPAPQRRIEWLFGHGDGAGSQWSAWPNNPAPRSSLRRRLAVPSFGLTATLPTAFVGLTAALAPDYRIPS